MDKNISIAVAVLVVLGFGAYFMFSPAPVPESSESPQGKIDINAVCEGALAYMTFTDGASAEVFVAECKEGKHPEVIERFKANMNLGDGAAL